MQMGLVQVSVQFPGIPVTILEVLYVAFGGRPYKISHFIPPSIYPKIKCYKIKASLGQNV
jgi:hypothetical protein